MLDKNFFGKLPITVAFGVKVFIHLLSSADSAFFTLPFIDNSHNGGGEGREEKFQFSAKSIKSTSWQNKIKIVGRWVGEL